MPTRPALPAYARLPLRFDTLALREALGQLPASAWTAHFNADYYSGDWSGVPLLSPLQAHDRLNAAHGGASSAGLPTAWYAPAWHQLLTQIPMQISSARLLRLGAGAQIREHQDPDLGDPLGDVRLHIPIISHPEVEFLLEGQVVPMAEGDCWFLDLARPHRVDNRSLSARIHLVIDARRNEWLRMQIAAGLPNTPHAHMARSTWAFAVFRQRVQNDPRLACQLNTLQDARTFSARAVELGAGLALHFSIDDVQAAMRLGRRAWFEQWRV
ncbi:MAG: aspartyl/asparaginyl beta-hydroxylase domain-containing protein [Pseudomonadota bacterium]